MTLEFRAKKFRTHKLPGSDLSITGVEWVATEIMESFAPKLILIW